MYTHYAPNILFAPPPPATNKNKSKDCFLL